MKTGHEQRPLLGPLSNLQGFHRNHFLVNMLRKWWTKKMKVRIVFTCAIMDIKMCHPLAENGILFFRLKYTLLVPDQIRFFFLKLLNKKKNKFPFCSETL